MSGGWFAVKRGITQHPVFKGHPERLAIWLWLIDNACWKDTPHDIQGKTVIVPRGAVAVSERRLAKEVGVGYQVVRTFLDRLKSEHMINAAVTHGRNIITLCNYEKYQSPPEPTNAPPNAELTHDQRTKEQGNNIPETNVSGAADLKAQVWKQGVALLEGVGVKSPRPLIGRWVKEHGEAEVLAAVLAGEGRADPVAFITARLKRSRKADEETDDYLARQGIRNLEDDDRNFSRGGDSGRPSARDAANDVPRMQSDTEEEARSVPERDVRTGEGASPLLALRMVVGGV